MDPNDLGPGTFAWLGDTGTVLVGGLLLLRKPTDFLSVSRSVVLGSQC